MFIQEGNRAPLLKATHPCQPHVALVRVLIVAIDHDFICSTKRFCINASANAAVWADMFTPQTGTKRKPKGILDVCVRVYRVQDGGVASLERDHRPPRVPNRRCLDVRRHCVHHCRVNMKAAMRVFLWEARRAERFGCPRHALAEPCPGPCDQRPRR